MNADAQPMDVSYAPEGSNAPLSRLSVMMFLQYAIWGAWLPLFFPFLLNHRGLPVDQVGNLIAIGAVGALFAPFIAGQIADRWFNTERFLGISHLIGGVLVWLMASAESFGGLAALSLLYGLIYAPTLPLTNSLAFHHLTDRDKQFGKVRVWGTIGWICVGIGIGQWLLRVHSTGDTPEAIQAAQYAGMADSLRLSGVLGVIMGLFCFTLPATPPQPGTDKFAPFEALRYVFKNPMRNPLFWLFVISFPMSCVHQFYFVHTAEFLNKLAMPDAAFINKIFGVGGGGLMTIGQIAEIAVLALVPLVAKTVPRKSLLVAGLCAYVLRFAVFAYFPNAWAVIPALALHGFCFGCFFFVAFMIVDEENAPDVRASAQGLYNLVVVGVGIIVGSWFAGRIGAAATPADGTPMNYRFLFSVPLWITVGCIVALLLFYPRKPSRQEAPAAA